MSAVCSVGILPLKYLALEPSNLLPSLVSTSCYTDHIFRSEISSANLFFLFVVWTLQEMFDPSKARVGLQVLVLILSGDTLKSSPL